ncbi:hypothetical protein K439DRAFT_863358 [Ramaria rubella]|nr:hypothetical protein K439DRAFT_863358 [Ramaria rubella]
MLPTRVDVQESRRGWRCIRMVKSRCQLYNGFVGNVTAMSSFVLCFYGEGDVVWWWAVETNRGNDESISRIATRVYESDQCNPLCRTSLVHSL